MSIADVNIVAIIGITDYVQTAYGDLKGDNRVHLVGKSIFDYYRSICTKFKIKPRISVYSILSVLFLIRYCSFKKKNIILLHGVDFLWLMELPLISMARKIFKASIVGYFWDVIDFIKYSVPQYICQFDLVITIDESLAQKYGCEYYPIFYSKEETPIVSDECDVFFCGEDGGRLELIESVYSELTKLGLKCDFYCSRSSLEGQTINGIRHIKQMPHSVYISHIKACRIILDIVKPGVSCCSLRFSEGVIYGKKVLTNNRSILNQEFYNEDQFFVFDKNLSFNKEFIEHEMPNAESYKYLVSPNRFVDYICNKLITR